MIERRMVDALKPRRYAIRRRRRRRRRESRIRVHPPRRGGGGGGGRGAVDDGLRSLSLGSVHGGGGDVGGEVVHSPAKSSRGSAPRPAAVDTPA